RAARSGPSLPEAQMVRSGLRSPSVAPHLGEQLITELQGASQLAESRTIRDEHKADAPATGGGVRLRHWALHAPGRCGDRQLDGGIRLEFAKTSTDKIDHKATCALLWTRPDSSLGRRRLRGRGGGGPTPTQGIRGRGFGPGCVTVALGAAGPDV